MFGSKLLNLLLVLYQGIIMTFAALAIVIGGFGTLLSGEWDYLLWSLLSVPLASGLAFGLPLLWAWMHQYNRTVTHKLRVYYGGKRDIVTLTSGDSRSQL